MVGVSNRWKEGGWRKGGEEGYKERERMGERDLLGH